MSKEKIYITGHRNPDLDSLCGAYAYAVLKNRIDPENEYIAVRCGHMTDSSKKIFGMIGAAAPIYKRDIFPKVEDVYLKSTTYVQIDDSLSVIASNYSDETPSVIPVFEGEKFSGLLSVEDILHWVMTDLSDNGKIDHAPIVKDIMREQEPGLWSLELFDDAKAKLLSSKKRGLAVYFDDKYVGYVTRRCFLKAPRHKLILVDHNEPRQSIMGIETADVVEILDHHRLDSVKTELPIYIDAEPLGSSCTIVYRQFVTHGIEPDALTAKVLLTGLISDTLILRSPTTTMVDVDVANKLAKLAGVDLQEYGLSMFSCIEGLKNRDPEEAINSDFKMYDEKEVRFGVGQCEVTTLHDLPEYSEKYAQVLEEIRQKNALNWAVLMITDVIKEHSVLISTDFKSMKSLRYKPISKNTFDMPGVMSRKKQLLPEILSVLNM